MQQESLPSEFFFITSLETDSERYLTWPDHKWHSYNLEAAPNLEPLVIA